MISLLSQFKLKSKESVHTGWNDYFNGTTYIKYNSTFQSNINYYAKSLKFENIQAPCIYYDQIKNANVKILIEDCIFSKCISDETDSTIFFHCEPSDMVIAKAKATICYGSDLSDYYKENANFLTVQNGDTVRFFYSSLDQCGIDNKGVSGFKFQYLRSQTKSINISNSYCYNVPFFTVFPSSSNNDSIKNSYFVNNSADISENSYYYYNYGCAIAYSNTYSIQRCIFSNNNVKALISGYNLVTINVLESAFINNINIYIIMTKYGIMDDNAGYSSSLISECYFEGTSTKESNAGGSHSLSRSYYPSLVSKLYSEIQYIPTDPKPPQTHGLNAYKIHEFLESRRRPRVLE